MGSHASSRGAFLGVAAILLASVMAPTTSAAPKGRDWAAIDAHINRLEARSASQKAIDAYLAHLGIIRVDEPDSGITALASTSNDVTLTTPKVYYDDRFERWVAQAKFSWKHNCGVYGTGNCVNKECGFGPCGGPDGFGIRSTRAFNEITTAFYTYDYDRQYTWTNPEEMNAFGAAHKQPDSYDYWGGYTWDAGTLYWFFQKGSCPRGTTVKLYSRLSHTWNDTSVTGFSISLSGFSIQWNSSAAHWEATNATPGSFTC